MDKKEIQKLVKEIDEEAEIIFLKEIIKKRAARTRKEKRSAA